MKSILGRRSAVVRVLVCAVLALGLSASVGGCSGIEKIGDTLEKGEKLATNLMFPTKEEIKLGRQVSKEFEEQVKLHQDPEVQAFIAELGQSLVAKADDKNPEIEFSFKVVDDLKTINALAMPGGHIYVYSGLIILSQSEAELAAVLSHEVAHVTRRHVLQRLTAVHGLEALQKVALGEDSSMAIELATDMATNGVILKYSRDHESDADLHGMNYLIGAGFNPQGFVDFFTKLASQESSTPEFLSSHPLPENRLKAVEKSIASRSNVPVMQTRDEDSWDAFKAKVISGSNVSSN